MQNSLPPIEKSLAELVTQTKAWSETLGNDPVVVGILSGGLWVAQHLSDALELNSPVASIDIGFHRDDYGDRGFPQSIQPNALSGSVQGKQILLVDDVIHTGRTIRAAMNTLFEYGRPKSIKLAVLLSRGQRELPVCADFHGCKLEIADQQRIKVSGPKPLAWEMQYV